MTMVISLSTPIAEMNGISPFKVIHIIDVYINNYAQNRIIFCQKKYALQFT